mgnify:CR=1 FL=1
MSRFSGFALMMESNQLEGYLRNDFLDEADAPLPSIPLADESHIAWWRSWNADGRIDCRMLAGQLPQLLFGVETGISKSDAYHRAILGGDVQAHPSGEHLPKGSIEFAVTAHWAGSLPVLTMRDRDLFEMLFRVLGFKGEPIDIAPSVHALLVVGLPNPGRLVATREAWERGELADDPLVTGCSTWGEAIGALDRGDPARFRDRILLVHEGPYASLAAEDVGVGLTESEWAVQSEIIRQEHEFAHYATRRLFGSMRFNLHDELIADCMGFTKAFGAFDAELFLNALGVVPGKLPDATARAWTYVRELSGEDVVAVCDLAAAAAHHVQAWLEHDGVPERPELLRALARVDLSTLAGSAALIKLRQAVAS